MYARTLDLPFVPGGERSMLKPGMAAMSSWPSSDSVTMATSALDSLIR